jgi:hypothetical protein
MYSTCS